MPQQPIEIILARQLAGTLAVPIFIVDPAGALLFYNEPAESILGRRFEETGRMAVEEWATLFDPETEDGTRLPPDDLPLVISVTEGRPAHREFTISALDETRRRIEVTSFPLIGASDRLVGAVAIFWEVS